MRLHKEHGLNPTLCTCFYCGQPTGELALLGDKYKGEAPKYMCTSIVPCDTCKESFKDKTVILENTSNDGSLDGVTGRWVALSKKYFNVDVEKSPIVYMSPEDFEQVYQQCKTVVETNVPKGKEENTNENM